ncbi:12358_t:CDS:2 [Funneliformis mosseae]|uniref:12358_t:CDS:1 n=1 Tax=Funneliformis mosseae TaxID=27381 RepID=A0A9N9B827_FUNMO|nr:12358_t:CDS:2 [Funneliformis mosseae]
MSSLLAASIFQSPFFPRRATYIHGMLEILGRLLDLGVQFRMETGTQTKDLYTETKWGRTFDRPATLPIGYCRKDGKRNKIKVKVVFKQVMTSKGRSDLQAFESVSSKRKHYNPNEFIRKKKSKRSPIKYHPDSLHSDITEKTHLVIRDELERSWCRVVACTLQSVYIVCGKQPTKMLKWTEGLNQ